jgi:FkbM family methyltransferase
MLRPLLPDLVYTALQAPVMAMDIRRGVWKEPEVNLIPYAVKTGETALDIGANFGMFTYHLSKAVGPQGKVISFEPVPFTARIFLGVSFWLGFKNVEFHNVGCSDKTGMIQFTVPLQASGGLAPGLAYIRGRNEDHPGKETQVRWDATRDVEARVVTLDEEIGAQQQLTLIKCDIEGAEPLAFRGGAKLIAATLPTVIVEINPWYLEGFGFKLSDLLDPFRCLGYELFHIEETSEGIRLKKMVSEIVVEDNYILIHPSRMERFRELLKH